ncbi:RBBP9/YdeN family alpha/beta hydrolase [Streptomyces sp. NRRL F-5123]|uniref:RBBP9/YdeN family alpha/beta hydrolase n=1 Tax=Streptomyces sp. NRRL F-5123 TaxID=1463856 RepID=UPI000AA19277|nr:alpha/beta fold hydrolase [Streptomyces sp. NRRL F-5123]
MVIPGIDGSDEAHWQSRWQQEWGGAAVRIAPGSWAAPELADWVAAVQAAYEAVGVAGEPVVLVAHSLGCWAAACWLEAVRPAGVAAFLVAPPDPRGPAFPRAAAPSFAARAARALPCPALVVAGEDDPYCDAGVSAGFAREWGARWESGGTHGHLNSASGLGEWPAGRALLATLVADAG